MPAPVAIPTIPAESASPVARALLTAPLASASAMLLDVEVGHCSRVCSRTGRALAPGETYFSTLHIDHGQPIRRDYAAEAWQGPANDCLGWWRSRIPTADAGKPKLAPQDVLLNLFAELAAQPTEQEFRYVLGLLLIRRRVLKVLEAHGERAGAIMRVECPRRDEQFELSVATPTAEQISELEARLVRLLYSGDE